MTFIKEGGLAMIIIKSGDPCGHGYAWILYGAAGLGKTTEASLADKPVLLDIERGANYVAVDRTPPILSWDAPQDPAQQNILAAQGAITMLSAMRWFLKSEYKTAIVDTADQLEVLLHAHVLADFNVDSKNKMTCSSLAHIPYGRGYKAAQEIWQKLISWIHVAKSQGKNVILTCHEQIVHAETPTESSYDRYSLKINKESCNLLTAAVDAVLWCHLQTSVVQGADDKLRAKSTGKRLLRCTPSPAILAKNRHGFGEYEPMGGSIYKKIQK